MFLQAQLSGTHLIEYQRGNVPYATPIDLTTAYSQLNLRYSQNNIQGFIRIEQFPKWGETITIHTWPSGKERLAYIRDFKILKQNEKVIGQARTKWFALDLKRKRPQNVDSYFDYDLTGVEQIISHQLSK